VFWCGVAGVVVVVIVGVSIVDVVVGVDGVYGVGCTVYIENVVVVCVCGCDVGGVGVCFDVDGGTGGVRITHALCM